MNLVRGNPKRNEDVLLITGDGRTVHGDLEFFKSWGISHDIMAIGRSIKLHEKADHWANVDGPGSKWWAEHLPGKPIRHTLGDCDGYDCIWDDGKPDGDPWYGSSALFAAIIALEMGYERIVLAGCPLDHDGHWYFGPEFDGPEWRPEDYAAWIEFSCTPRAKKVKSLSGFTKRVLDE